MNFSPASSSSLDTWFARKAMARQAKILAQASYPPEETLLNKVSALLNDNPLTARGSANMYPYAVSLTPATPGAWPMVTPVVFPAELYTLADQVVDGNREVVRGVYVDDVLALPVIQQPEKAWAYVSEQRGYVTEFQNARLNGVTGLLAHNYLSGELFYKIRIGDEVDVVYGDGTIKRYQVSTIATYQKLNSSSLTSDLIDLQTGERMSSTQVFDRHYTGTDQVTFQTCLERAGDPSWGLTFITAAPIK